MIVTRGLTKQFMERSAVEGLDLEIEAGSGYALLGPLGCGNSCVIKMLAGLVKITRGAATLAGVDIRREPLAAQRVTGYMPDLLGVFDDMKVEECLFFFALGHGLEPAAAQSRTGELLGMMEMERLAGEYVESLDRESRGRLGLARALLHAPRALLLDKPAVGLDMAARARFFSLARRAREQSAQPVTLLLASNLLSDALACCSRIGVMLNGKLIDEGPAGQIAAKLAPYRIFEVEARGSAARAADWLRRQPAVAHADAQGDYLVFSLVPEEAAATEAEALMAAMQAEGFGPFAWREHEIDFNRMLTPAG